MAPSRRSSTRRARSPSASVTASVTATPTTASSLRSGRTRSSANTPATSVSGDEIEEKSLSRHSTRSTRASTRKRPAQESASEADTASSRPPLKRRATKDVFVELPVRSKPGNPRTVSAPAGRQTKSTRSSRSASTTGSLPPVDSASDSEPSIVEESDDSGSDFAVSANGLSDDDEEQEAVTRVTRNSPRKRGMSTSARGTDWSDPADANVDEEDDELMLQAGLRESLRATRDGTDGGASGSRATDAELRAAAAERRIKDSNGVDVDDSEFAELDSDVDEESAFSSEDDSEPLSGGRKRKAKGQGKKKAKAPVPVRGPTPEISWEDMRQRKITRAVERKEQKKAEAELMYKLGRKLTHSEKTTVALGRKHPELKDVWGNLEKNIEVVQPQKAEQPANLKVTLLPFQQESLYWMRKQEQTVWAGGMLADEMGMGKTIQIISLLMSARERPNLVVAPTVAVMQWRNEIDAHTDGMKVLVWHGQNRESSLTELKKYDVVLTTYAVLESCFRKQQSGFKRKGQIIKEKSVVHQITWSRIILDEAHNIKERATNTAKAAFELKGKFRWCLSGTPLQNRVGELYSLIRFLGGDPFAYYFCKSCDCKSLHWQFSNKRNCDHCGHTPMQHTCLWNNEILTPIQKHGMVGPGQFAFKKLRILLDRMMLRRTKIERADDLGLPPRTVIIRRDYFSPEEKELYLSLFSDAKRAFSTYVDSGTVLNNYSNIFSLLTRMRQMACHPDLVLRSKTNVNTFVPEDQVGEATVCRLCNDIAEDAIQSRCRHVFDRECIKQYLNCAIEQTPSCPVCHLPLTIDLEAPALELEENQKHRQGILGRLNIESWRSSTKIEALVEELDTLRRQDASTKSIVFSQFVNFLDLIAFRLQRAGFVICRLEGTMSPQARDATIKHFMNNVHVTVFLVSLKAGGVALNLTEASRVYLMDSWWNPAVEFQAMDRIHRLGQHRPVKAIKMVVEDSIESRIVQLQEKKSAMIDATLSTDEQAMGRLTPEDLSFLFRL